MVYQGIVNNAQKSLSKSPTPRPIRLASKTLRGDQLPMKRPIRVWSGADMQCKDTHNLYMLRLLLSTLPTPLRVKGLHMKLANDELIDTTKTSSNI